MSKISSDVMLSCGCTFNDNGIQLRVAELVTCRFHGPAKVLRIGLGHYAIVCRNCAYKNTHPGRLKAETMGASHRRRRHSHIVDIYSPDGKVHYTYGGKDTEPPTIF